MKRMVRIRLLTAMATAMALAPVLATAQVNVPPGFTWQVLAAGFQLVKHSAIDQPGGMYGGTMFVAELGGNVVDQVLPNGIWAPYVPPGVVAGPVGLAIDFGGAYGGFMYVGETGTPNVIRILPGGGAVLFAAGLNGTGGIAFDPGLGYGGFLYCAEWAAPGPLANCVMRVAPNGVPAMFCPLPGADPRYLAFDTTTPPAYGGFLWVSEFATGNVRSLGPNGVPAAPLANVGPGVEGIAFGLGDPAFGSAMYTANLVTGTINRITPAGVVLPFANTATGAAYIQFVPAASPYALGGMPTMILDDGNATIYQIAPIPSGAVAAAAPAAATRLLGAAPNPLLSAARVRYELEAPEDVLLRVFDARGAFVTTLVRGIAGAGAHEVAWDGRGRDGQAVASGVYFLALEAGPARTAAKIVVER